MKRRICYISGTRADFGLLAGTLRRAWQHPSLEVSIHVTGMHLSTSHGYTVRDIETSGLPIGARIAVDMDTNTGAGMANALGHQLLGLVASLQTFRPHLVLLLGDRGEMMAGALAAAHLNIPIAHIHGGERSGTVDESIRHAISKLAHYHFTATETAKERLIRMGESPSHVFVTGAPGLDDIAGSAAPNKKELCRQVGLDPNRPVALVIYHPVLQTADQAGAEMACVLEGTREAGVQILCFAPNADAGNQAIREKISAHSRRPDFKVVTHMDRPSYLSWLASAEVLVGNSSSGIIEAASVGLPVINVGDRQNARERNTNTTDVVISRAAIFEAVSRAIAKGRYPSNNLYGDGRSGERIVELLSSLPLSLDLLKKSNAY